MEWLRKEGTGVIIRCKAHPSASNTKVAGMLGDELKISLAAPAVDGKANKALRTFLAKKLSISKSKVSLVSGEKSRSKTLFCDGVTLEAARNAFPIAP